MAGYGRVVKDILCCVRVAGYGRVVKDILCCVRVAGYGRVVQIRHPNNRFFHNCMYST